MKQLTEGKPSLVLLKFSLPMFVSVIFQQMYNIADSVIAGKFAGEDALAAVGASYPITMIFMAVAVGSNIGCSVIISQFFGAKEYKKVKTAATTTLIASLGISILLTVLGLALCVPLMKMINTPSNVFADGSLYLRIYTAGLIFLFLYNVCTGIFTSLGDSKTPLYFLIGSSLGNILLDYIFVAICKWGVAGVAWATFIAQGISCILVLITLKFKLEEIITDGKPDIFSAVMLKKISLYAIPSILQQSFVSVGNIFIQGLVNGFGSSCIAGYSAAIKLNTFTITSVSTLSNGLSGFVAQNYGARKPDRIRKGYFAALKFSLLVSLPFFLLFFFAGRTMIGFFMDSQSSEAIKIGITFLKIVSPFYFFVGIKITSDGLLRGLGAMQSFMIATFTDLILRVILAFIFSKPWGSTGIWLSWPVGWLIAMFCSVGFAYYQLKRLAAQTKQQEI